MHMKHGSIVSGVGALQSHQSLRPDGLALPLLTSMALVFTIDGRTPCSTVTSFAALVNLSACHLFHAGCLLYVALITSRSLHHYWAQGLTVLDISLQPRLLRLPSRGLQVSLPRNTDNPRPTAAPSATSDADLHSPCSTLQWHVSAPQDLPVMPQPGK